MIDLINQLLCSKDEELEGSVFLPPMSYIEEMILDTLAQRSQDKIEENRE